MASSMALFKFLEWSQTIQTEFVQAICLQGLLLLEGMTTGKLLDQPGEALLVVLGSMELSTKTESSQETAMLPTCTMTLKRLLWANLKMVSW